MTTIEHHFRSFDSSIGGDAVPVLSTSIVGIKIDTQGMEPEIFMGARSILNNHSARLCAMVMEFYYPSPCILKNCRFDYIC